MVKDDATGEIRELHCTYDPDTKNAAPADGRKVDGVIHWVSAVHAVPVTVRLYDRLFKVADPAGAEGEMKDLLNPGSLEVVDRAYVEPGLGQAKPGEKYQFERTGYFCCDTKDSLPLKPVFNRIATLRDSWAKISAK